MNELKTDYKVGSNPNLSSAELTEAEKYFAFINKRNTLINKTIIKPINKLSESASSKPESMHLNSKQQEILDECDFNGTTNNNATDKLLSLRSQLSSAIYEIDAVVGKNGQIQHNISTHEKQAKEIEQSRKFSGPTL